MVYRGKLSKACLQCRRKKLRCDLQRASCGQCARAALVCSGYRNTEQLRIQDESQTTKQKVLTRGSKATPQTLNITIDDKARNAFFSHYVSGFSTAYDVLPPLYKQSPLNGHLAASVDAVSLAFFSFQFNCTRASRMAREKYLYALPLLSKALRSPESAMSDSTFLAVLLLDLFEKITNNNPRSAFSWMSHVNGALALVKMRDHKQFQTYTGLRLSVRLSTNLLISCVAADAPVPPELTKLRSDLEPFLNKNDPKWQVSGLVVKYANIRGSMLDERLSSSEIFARAVGLDEEFILLAKTMPSTWVYETTHIQEPSERVFKQHFDRYPDHFITQTWNVLRIMRILLNDLMRTYCVVGTTESCKEGSPSHHLAIATNTIDLLAREICATVPQYTRDDTANLKSTRYFATHRLRCSTLLFPLYVAGSYATDTTKIKPWITEQLRFMSNEIGLRNANVVAEILERADGTSPWAVYAILGSYAFAA